MKTKPYAPKGDEQNKVSEPMMAYAKTEKVSINEWNMSASSFNGLIEKAENDFVTGRFITSEDLLHKIKEQRGWL